LARDNPEFYKDTDPDVYSRITKPGVAASPPRKAAGEQVIMSPAHRELASDGHRTHRADDRYVSSK
jgi:hypothetical protein